MAEDKKAFVLYTDLIHTVEKLPDEISGKLFKIILEYVNDRNPVIEDMLLVVAFEPIKRQLKRDLKKYESRADRSRSNGAKGGRPTKPKGTQENPKEPRKPDTVTDTDTDIDTVTVIDTVKETDINNNYSKEVISLFLEVLRCFPIHLHPSTPKTKNNWLQTLKRLITIDKLDPEIILQIIKFTRENDFWSKNFLSVTKLRKNNRDGVKYVTVFYEQMKSKNGKQTYETPEQFVGSAKDISTRLGFDD